MHINQHPRPLLSVRAPYTIPPRHHRALVEMSSSDFNSLSAPGTSVPAGGAEGCDWDTATTMEGLFQDGYSNPPLLPPAAAFGGQYNAFQPENGASNTAAVRGFETQPQQQQQQFGTQMLSYTTNKFVPRPAASSFQVSQANEYWASLAASTTTNQNNNWKMDYNNNNAVLSDFTRCGGAYDEFTPLPLQTGGRLSSFSLGEDGQSPDDVLHFSPDGDGLEYGEKRWGDNLKHREQSTSHHGLPYTFFDDTTANPPLSIFPPGPAAQWSDTTHLDTVSPKALTLSSSSVSFSGSSSSDCGSIDSVSTTDGFSFQSAGETIQGVRQGLEQEKREVEVRHKLPTRPLRQYVAIAPSLERDRVVEVPRMVKTSPSTATAASQNHPAPARRDSHPHPQSPMTRTTKDAFLISSKRAGMSYRAIRQAGNFSEAESTLRGRYRTLTKQKEERVRKPEWTAGDVKLLREAVERFRCGRGDGRKRGRGGKTPWKRVAEYIEGNGGSYRFGNATCRKMWDRLGEEEEEG